MNPYKSPQQPEFDDELLQQGRELATEIAMCGDGRGMIVAKLRKDKFAEIHAEKLADDALRARSRHVRITGIGSIALSCLLLALAGLSAFVFEIKVPIIIAMTAIFSFFYGLMNVFHRSPRRQDSSNTKRIQW